LGRPLPADLQNLPIIGPIVDWLNKICEEIQNWISYWIKRVYEKLPSWVKDIFDWFWKVYYYVGKAIIDFFTDPIGSIKKALGAVYDMLPSWVKDIFDWIWKLYIWLGEKIYNFFANPVETLKNLAGKVWDVIPDWVKTPINWLKQLATISVDLVINFFKDPVGTLGKLANKVWELLPDWLKNAITLAKDTIVNFVSEFPKKLGEAKNAIETTLGNTAKGIHDAIDGAVSSIGNAFAGIWKSIEDWLKGIPGFLTTVKDAAWGALKGFFEMIVGAGKTVLDVAKGAFSTLVEWGKDAISGLKDIAGRIAAFLGDLLLKPIGEMFDNIADAVHKKIGLSSPELIFGAAAPALSTLVASELACGTVTEGAEGVGDTKVEGATFGIRPGIAKVLKALDLRGMMNSMMQGYIMGLSMAYFSGTVLEQVRRQSLEAGRPLPPSPSEAAWMFRKKLIKEDLYKKAIARGGYMKDYEEAYLENIWMYPPYQDMIKIFIREAYEKMYPEMYAVKIADYPPDFGKWMEYIGYKEEWAKRLWAAHWNLPGTSQIYEMLWRGVKSPYTGAPFTINDVTKFLKEADIDPRFREQLAEIAYKLPGRIEARWGLEWGVWDENKFIEFLKADGIHPNWIPDILKAEKANVFREHITTVKSAIIKKVKYGYITFDTARSALKKLSYPDQAINLIIQAAEEEYDLEIKDDLKNAYVAAFRNGTIDEAKLRELLRSIPMTEEKINKIVEAEKYKLKVEKVEKETIQLRLERLKEQEKQQILVLQDAQSDLDYAKKRYDAEKAIWEEKIKKLEYEISLELERVGLGRKYADLEIQRKALSDAQSDLDYAKKKYDAEKAVWDEKIRKLEYEISIETVEEKRRRKEMDLDRIKKEYEKAMLAAEHYITEVTERIGIIEEKIKKIEDDIAAEMKVLGKERKIMDLEKMKKDYEKAMIVAEHYITEAEEKVKLEEAKLDAIRFEIQTLEKSLAA
jgi:hypothetical protein